MNTKILIAILAGALIIFGLTFFLIKPAQNNSKVPATAIVLKGSNNQKVTANNFITKAPIQNTSVTILYSDDFYSIQYENTTNKFTITFNAIKAGDFVILTDSRNKAEKFLMQQLGVTQTDACKLSVAEEIQRSPALPYTVYSYPLSFCTTDTTFPK